MNRPLSTVELRRNQVMKAAILDGIFTDHQSDGVCQQLTREGWLERAAPIAKRPHVNRADAYLPTDKAINEWDIEASPSPSP
jgi:hypothetical protein